MVGDVSGVHRKPSSQSSGIPKQPKIGKEKAPIALQDVKNMLGVAGKTTSTARSIASIVNAYKKISSSLSKALKLTKAPSIALTPFNIYEVGKNALDIVKKEGLKQKAWATFNLLMSLDKVVDSIASTCGIIYAFRTVSSKLIDWVPIYSVVSFFVGFVSLGMSAVSVHESKNQMQALRKVLKELETKKTDPEKAQVLGDFLKAFNETMVDGLFKKLMISKKAMYQGLLVKDRIVGLANKHLQGEGIKGGEIAEAEMIVRTLAGRVKMDFGFKVADIASNVVSTIGRGFVTFAPLLPVGYIILATTGLFSLGMIGGKMLFVSKNPFDPEAKTRAKELVGSIRIGISHLGNRLHAISLWTKTHALRPA